MKNSEQYLVSESILFLLHPKTRTVRDGREKGGRNRKESAMPNGVGPNHLLIRPAGDENYIVHFFQKKMFCYELGDPEEPLFHLPYNQLESIYSYLVYWCGPRYTPREKVWCEYDFEEDDQSEEAKMMRRLVEKFPPAEHGGFPIFMTIDPPDSERYRVSFFSTVMSVYDRKEKLFELPEEQVLSVFDFLEYWTVYWFEETKGVDFSF